MNTIEILNKVKNDSVLKQIFAGVFPLDLPPKIHTLPCALILNLDKSNSPGSHWVALYFNTENICEYFDSYGRKPENEILEYISGNAKSYVYNNLCIQDFWTMSCGQMCLYFLTWRCRNIAFIKIVKYMLNDDFITGFIDSL